MISTKQAMGRADRPANLRYELHARFTDFGQRFANLAGYGGVRAAGVEALRCSAMACLISW
jgi:hypothetical protein